MGVATIPQTDPKADAIGTGAPFSMRAQGNTIGTFETLPTNATA
jgi:hypothetical protein